MSETANQVENLPRRGNDHRAFWWTCGAGLLLIPLALFLPWDAPMPVAPDLEALPPPILEAENAFIHFKMAGEIANTQFKTPDGQDWDSVLLWMIGSAPEAWDPKFADEVLAANAAALAEVEQGLACPHYASPEITSFKTSMPWLQKTKKLNALLRLKSKRAQLAGDYPEASRWGLQEWRLGAAVSKGSGSLAEWLTGYLCQGFALERLTEIASDAKTPDPVLREILEAANRWTPEETVQGYRQAVRHEYLMLRINSREFRRDLNFFSSYEFESWTPYCSKHQATLQIMVPLCHSLIDQADQPYAKFKLDYPGMPREMTGEFPSKLLFYVQPNSRGRSLCLGIGSNFKFSLAKRCYLESQVAALRLKIALRLYEMKHGELPETLEALVSEYLQAVPADPYDGQPFRYSKSERKVWAIGKDLKDQSGNLGSLQSIMNDSRGSDVVMPLDVREMKPTLYKPPETEKPAETE